jgi:protein-disulfide isomerase
MKKNSRAFLPVLALIITLLILPACARIPSSPTLPPEPASNDNQSAFIQTGQSIPAQRSTVKIIVYTDFECGACEKFHSEIEPELRERYVATGEAQIEIKLLGAIGPESLLAAEAALCAADQNHFIEYEDALFSAWLEKGTDAYSNEELLNLAANLDLDEAAFQLSLANGSKKPELEQNMTMARHDGVHVLPAVIIAGTKVEGFKPLDAYVNLIEQSLKDNGN